MSDDNSFLVTGKVRGLKDAIFCIALFTGLIVYGLSALIAIVGVVVIICGIVVSVLTWSIPVKGAIAISVIVSTLVSAIVAWIMHRVMN